MAKRTCPYCKKKDVNNKATICPYCRQELTPVAFFSTSTGKLVVIFLVLWGLATLGGMAKDDTLKEKQTHPNITIKKDTQKKQIPKETRERIAKFGERPVQSAWDGSYRAVESYLENIANDPGSIDISACTEVYHTKDGWLVGCDYRGKNSFGALIKNSNWFIIINNTVVAMKATSAYSTK